MLSEFILKHEAIIRLSCFIAIFAIMALWELHQPRRVLSIPKTQRWYNNLSLALINTVLLRIAFPAAALGAASFAQANGWGLLNLVSQPLWFTVPLSIIVMDLVIYLQHVSFHKVPAFWRLHRVHHADIDFDVTTGIRFHPIEILLSMLIKIVTIFLLGPSLLAIILFEILLNGTSLFNHGNVRLPLTIDQLIRKLIVTPDMHRIHHSSKVAETNSNYGFNFSFWDRCFSTYQDKSALPQETMPIGLADFRKPEQVSQLSGMLLMPLKALPKQENNDLT